jgi:hypothetical protein
LSDRGEPPVVGEAAAAVLLLALPLSSAPSAPLPAVVILHFA